MANGSKRGVPNAAKMRTAIFICVATAPSTDLPPQTPTVCGGSRHCASINSTLRPLKRCSRPDIPERAVEAERTAGTRISLTIRFTAGLRIDVGGGAVGNCVGNGIENITSADARGEVLQEGVRHAQVGGRHGREQLAGIVVLVPK